MPTHLLLLDNNVPIQLIPLLRPHEATHASTAGWAALSNGNLIREAHRAEFTAIVTCDQNIQHQQNLAGYALAFVVLTTTHWATIRDNVAGLLAAIEAATPGSYATVNLPRPTLRRRPYLPV